MLLLLASLSWHQTADFEAHGGIPARMRRKDVYESH